MKIYDISQEVFSCQVFPGDPAPKKEVIKKISEGSVSNLSAFSMCSHNGTHVDAPNHFVDNGKKIDEMGLENFVGMAYVAEHEGMVTAEDATAIIERARKADVDCAKIILIKGEIEVIDEAAAVFAGAGLKLIGVESQTIGPEDGRYEVHRILLGAEVVILEGIRLGAVKEGKYFLSAAPINLGGCEGAPCRAVLVDL